jgi:hypothetical protein
MATSKVSRKAAATKATARKAPKALKATAKKVLAFTPAGLTGAKATILNMMQATGGTTAPEVCEALGWQRCGATISRVIKAATAAGFNIAKARVDGVTRYSATTGTAPTAKAKRLTVEETIHARVAAAAPKGLLTEMERQAIAGILESDYMDGLTGDDAVDKVVWTWSGNPFSSKRTFSGVVSSLTKKGFVGSEDNGGKDDVIWITRAGMDAYEAAEATAKGAK